MTPFVTHFTAEGLDREPLRIVDMFCGVGGLSLGWLDAASLLGIPARLVAAVDADPSLGDVIAHNFPQTRFVQYRFGDPAYKDESDEFLATANLERGKVDILVAGPPCQSFSAAGKRERHADHRLVFHVCNAVRALNPKIVLIENVTQFQTAEEGRLLGRVQVQLANADYLFFPARLDASLFGVPQKRLRFFTLAVQRACAEGLTVNPFDRLVREGRNRSKTKAITTVSDAIGDLPQLAAGEGTEEACYTSEPKTEYQKLLRQSQQTLLNHVAADHSAETIAAMAALLPGERPLDSESHPMRDRSYFRAAYARLAPDGLAGTMTTQTQNPGSGRFTHFLDNRVLTVREVARIQSFPDSFRFLGGPSIQRRHVGNAVPPLVANAIAQQVLPVLLK